MRIAILGKGNVGSALGRGWRKAGHDVIYGVREAKVGDEKAMREAVTPAEVVVLATPWPALAAVVAAAGDLAGKTVIDCTNPVVFRDGRLRLDTGTFPSGAEALAALAPAAFVFKTLNQTGAENLGDGGRFAAPSLMFVAGDNADRKAVVLALVADLGFEPLDAGPLANARLLEALALLWIDQSRSGGRDFAIARLPALRPAGA